MRKRFFAALIALTLITLCAAAHVSAAVTDKPRVIDDADLLTAEQEAAITSKLNEFSAGQDCDFVVLTEPDLDHGSFSFNGSVRDYADVYYEVNGYSADGVLVFITLDDGSGYRMVWISTSGKCIKRLTEDEQSEIIDDAYFSLKGGDYYSALDTITSGINDKLTPRLKGYMLPLAIVIGFAISMIIMMVIRGKLKTVSMQRGAANYVRPGSMNVRVARDTYLYSTVSRTAKQSSSSSGGSHTSSGGGTHGGSGRRF